MQINLLTNDYKNDERFYQAFLNDEIWKSEYLSNEVLNIPEELPEFPIFFAIRDKDEREAEYSKMIKVVADSVIQLDRDIFMDERFWHSWLCLYKREYLLDIYPQIKDDYQTFKNIVIKKFDWENYIYKAILIAQYVDECVVPEKHTHYYHLILQNMDMFNYIIKYEIFRNGRFLINIMDIIEETGLSKVLKAKIKNRPDLGKDERYGRRVIFELNKAYPIVMSPMLEKERLKEYFLKYLGYYYQGAVIEMDEDELAFQIADRYISIQETDDGYDYSIMGTDYKEIDGGVYDNPDVTIREALADIVDDLKMEPDYNGAKGNIRVDDELIPIDYDGLMEKVEEANQIVPED